MTYMSYHPIFDRKTEKIKKKIGHSSLSKIMGRLLWDCLGYLIFFFVFFSAIRSKIGQYGHVNQTEINQKNMSKKKKDSGLHPIQWSGKTHRLSPMKVVGTSDRPNFHPRVNRLAQFSLANGCWSDFKVWWSIRYVNSMVWLYG